MDELVYFYPEGHEAHQEAGHPERPARIETIRQWLQEAGWWDQYPHLEPLNLSMEFLSTIHTPEYLKRLEKFSGLALSLDGDTYTTRASWQLALNAAGGSAAVAGAVWRGQGQRGFALNRPPGHHATASAGMGFCLLNNIAIAAQYVLKHPLENAPNARKLAIVDLDLHHGNGTQDIFWERNDLLFISTHQSPLYPGSGSLEERGAGEGLGCTANFPLPPATGDTGYLTIMEGCILPLLDRFAPEMVLVDVGFDPHWRDPLGHLRLSAAGYGTLISRLTGWADQHCDGKIALFTEGGYDLEAGAACAQAAVAALLGQPWEDPIGPSPRPDGESWWMVYQKAREIWQLS
ncbi:MAG: histone deacetylase [Anaerolineales bacterium]|nr:histone deacetylase [Anaerolineales bacterium]